MIDEKNKEIIKQKQAEIEKLKKEIKDLKEPTSLYQQVDEKILWVTRGKLAVDRLASSRATWDLIRKLALELYRPKKAYLHQNMKINLLTHEEINVAAEMSNEIIGVWNKYMRKVYGGDEK